MYFIVTLKELPENSFAVADLTDIFLGKRTKNLQSPIAAQANVRILQSILPRLQ
jgi:hypothetical protein